MSGPVKTVLLAVVILACLGFVVFRLTRSSGSGGSGGGGGGAEAAAESTRDLYCTECKTHYTAVLKREQYMPLFVMGANASPKHTCTACGKPGGVAAIKCAACGEWVPSPGTQGLNRPGGKGGPAGGGPASPPCPKCKKPLQMPPMGGSGQAAPGAAQ